MKLIAKVELGTTVSGHWVGGCQGCSVMKDIICDTLKAKIKEGVMSFECFEFIPKHEKCETCGESKSNIHRWGCFSEDGICAGCTDNEYEFWCINKIQCRECYDEMCRNLTDDEKGVL